jgi:metal-responsive CopG/Arc/MetJ family transcriptional regulator
MVIYMFAKKGHRTIQIGIRVDEELLDEIDDLAQALLATRTNVIMECLKHGLPAFKAARPEIVRLVESFHRQEETEKKRLGSHR